MKRTLYIDTPGTVVRRDGGALVVERDDHVLERLPVHRLERLMLWGGAQITTPALRMVVEAGADVAFLGERGFIGAVRGAVSGGLFVLLAQVDAYRDAERSLVLAREVVATKCLAQAELVAGARRAPADVGRGERVAELKHWARRAADASSLDALRGIEGTAARDYFEALGRLVRPPFSFEGRNRRPPRDPVNALLSLGYMMLATEIRADVEARGFDPRLGFLHTVRAGRPALALDLMEPWRAPVVDRLVLTLINRQQLKPDDFEPGPEGGIRLIKSAFARFIDAWEAHLGGREPTEGLPSLRRQIAAWLDGFEARLVGDTSLPDPANTLDDP